MIGGSGCARHPDTVESTSSSSALLDLRQLDFAHAAVCLIELTATP
jgi:hypothetical protein